MNSKLSKDSKFNKTAALLFAISGIIFILVGIVSGKIGIFLPIGIALIIISIGLWQRNKKLTNNEYENSSDKQ